MRHPGRWLALIGISSLLGLGALLWSASGSLPPTSPPAPAQARVPRSPRSPRVPRPSLDPGPGTPSAGSEPSDERTEGWHRSWRARADAVVQRCGLRLVSDCRGPTCVSLLQGPDLDRPRGWLQLSLRSPAFVLSTALRDLGVPPTALPCGQAIADLAPSGQIAAVELDDGTEIWCVAGDVRDDPGREGQARRLCDVVARDTVGAQAARFTEEGLRELSFDPRSAR